MIRILAALVLIAGGAFPAGAQCRQALVLALDISGSVDAREYRQQLDGVAGALSAPTVRAALLAMPGAFVDLAVFEWAGPQDQRLLLPWTTLATPDAISTAAAILAATRRGDADPSTAIGAAIGYADALLGQRPLCWRRVVDISGDGVSNTGPRPQDIGTRGDATINALVIGSESAAIGDRRMVDVKELSGYFAAHVIRGSDAFVEIAIGYDDYRAAMERKLLRELRVLAIGSTRDDYGSALRLPRAPMRNGVAPKARPLNQTSPQARPLDQTPPQAHRADQTLPQAWPAAPSLFASQ